MRTGTQRLVTLSLVVGWASTAIAEAPDVVQRDWQQVLASGQASEDPDDLTRWTVVPSSPKGKGLTVPVGPMIYADTRYPAQAFTYDPRLKGWHTVWVGLYLPPKITYTGVAMRLSDEKTFTCVADPRASLGDRGKGYKRHLDADFVEVRFKGADLTGRKLIVHHPEGCWSYVTHLRFVPMTAEAIEQAKASDAKTPFDVHLWLDILDYAGLATQRPEKDWWQNSAKGVHRIVRYFNDYGGNCLGYRIMGGGRARYNSKVLRGERERYLDKRVGTDMRDPWGRFRYGDIDVDLLGEWVKSCHFYGKKAYAVWCFEEGHGYPVFLASYNLEHPQYLSRYKDGTFNLSWASLAHPEVVEHKLAVLDELIERGVDGVVFDFQRVWGWYQKRDMTHHHRGLGGWNKGFDPPIVNAYQKAYGVDPRTEAANNRRWIEFCARYHTDFFRKVKARCDRSGRRVEIVMTVPALSTDPYTSIRAYGCDWETWVSEGIITALAPIIPPTAPDGKAQTIDDVASIMKRVHDKCRGKVQVIWPLAYYKRTVSTLAKHSKLSVPDYTDRLLKLAHACGGAGVTLTTVDHNMTRPNQAVHIDTVMRLHDALNGACRYREE